MLIDQGRAASDPGCDVYLAIRGAGGAVAGQRLAEGIRDRLPGLGLVVHAGGGSFKSQLRRADRSGARIALILGESELAAGTVGVKFLREQREQFEISQSDAASTLASLTE